MNQQETYETRMEARSAGVRLNEYGAEFVIVYELNGRYGYRYYHEIKYVTTILPRGAKNIEYLRYGIWVEYGRSWQDELRLSDNPNTERVISAIEMLKVGGLSPEEFVSKLVDDETDSSKPSGGE